MAATPASTMSTVSSWNTLRSTDRFAGTVGAIAFGIGTTQVRDILATQCLAMAKPRLRQVRVEGALAKGVYAKDVILAVIAEIGTGGGQGYVIEYRGQAVRDMSMEIPKGLALAREKVAALRKALAPRGRAGDVLAVSRFSTLRDGHVLHCKVHGWEFDLDTGRCLNADVPEHRIRARRVD